MKLVVRLLPALFLLVLVGLVAYGLGALTGSTAGPPAPHSDSLADLQAKVDLLKWVLGLILAAAGLFTIAQGAAAFFTAQSFVKQADDAIKRVQEIAADAETRYPLFSKAEEARRDAYRALATIFDADGLDWRENLYSRLELADRQRLISVERFVGLEFIGWSENETEYAHNLRRLGNFYASKYVFEKRSYRGDLERAEYYLQLAREITHDEFFILNDLGLLRSEISNIKAVLTDTAATDPDRQAAREQLREAADLFRRSLNKNSQQQRARYNLAVLATYEDPPQWSRAADILTEALKENVWERTEAPEMTCNVLYNLACANARLAAGGAAGKLEECFDALEKAARIGAVKKGTLEADADKPEGDLYGVAHHQQSAIQERFRALRPRLSTPTAQPPRKSFRNKIMGAWAVLRDKA